MVTVMLRSTWPGTFRRGGITFNPGKPVQLTPQQFLDCAKDIGPALVPVELRKDGKPLILRADDVDLNAMVEEAKLAIATDPGVADGSAVVGQNRGRRK